MTYRRRPSPLHAARALASGAFCLGLGTVALATDNPLVLFAVLLAVCGATVLAGLRRELVRAMLLAVPFALVVALINPIVSREGLTVIARGPNVPVLGAMDITSEALFYGAILGLRALAVVLTFNLYALAVDPDEVLRLFRRVSFRSALTATIATRMVPVLARDGKRFADAQRCRPGTPAPRLAVVRAVATGALERAVDVAATLEVRGYGSARRAPRLTRPWSRHDIAFATSAAVLFALVAVIPLAGLAPFEPYPVISAPVGPSEIAVAVVIVLVSWLPFADRRGVVR